MGSGTIYFVLHEERWTTYVRFTREFNASPTSLILLSYMSNSDRFTSAFMTSGSKILMWFWRKHNRAKEGPNRCRPKADMDLTRECTRSISWSHEQNT
jgi:hypothetical protein